MAAPGKCSLVDVALEAATCSCITGCQAMAYCTCRGMLGWYRRWPAAQRAAQPRQPLALMTAAPHTPFQFCLSKVLHTSGCGLLVLSNSSPAYLCTPPSLRGNSPVELARADLEA